MPGSYPQLPKSINAISLQELYPAAEMAKVTVETVVLDIELFVFMTAAPKIILLGNGGGS